MLVGRPGRFSAGFDLATMTASAESMRGLVAAGGRFVARLLAEPLPVVAVCTGHALAAGALVLLAADHRIGVAGEFKIGLNEVAIGMALPVWAVELARYRMPPSEVDRIVLGEIGDPDEACASRLPRPGCGSRGPARRGESTAVRLAGLRTGAVAGTKSRRGRGWRGGCSRGWRRTWPVCRCRRWGARPGPTAGRGGAGRVGRGGHAVAGRGVLGGAGGDRAGGPGRGVSRRETVSRCTLAPWRARFYTEKPKEGRESDRPG